MNDTGHLSKRPTERNKDMENNGRNSAVSIDTRDYWTRKAIVLSYFTIFYNLVEGVVAILFGISDESFALFGFGADSFIEVGSAMLVLWRFRQENDLIKVHQDNREKKASIAIGFLFLLLTVITLVGSSIQLWNKSHPTTTIPGVIVAGISLSFMFFLWRAKLQVAQKLGSSVVRGDASCSLACIKLSGILFVGSLLYLLLPSLWWVDSLAAIILSVFIGMEGLEIIEESRKGKSGACGCK